MFRRPRGAPSAAEPTRTDFPYQYGFAREALSDLAATETYGPWVTLDPLRASERSLRCVWQAMGHAERLRRLVTMGVLVQLGLSLECCSEGASFWDDLEDPARTPARTGSHAASQLPCLSRCRRCMVPHLCPAYLAFRRRLMRHADILGPPFSLRQPLASAAGRCESQPAPCRLVETLETEAPSEPRSMPCPRP